MVNILINKIVEVLKRENEDRRYQGFTEIYIPFNIATLEQSLGDDKYKELLEDCSKYNTIISYIPSNDNDSYNSYTNGNLIINFELESDDEYNRTYLNKQYKISFDLDPRDWGYCQCGKEDKDYDARHNCCGHGCDWTAPSFSISKIISLGNDSFRGDENDFWKYEDKFYNITEKDKDESKKQSEIARITEQIEYLNSQLAQLNK